MAVEPSVPLATPSWQSRLVDLLVRARMRPHAFRPIDPQWVRGQMGRPRAPRRWMTRVTGVDVQAAPSIARWPGGEIITSPVLDDTSAVLLYLHGGGFIACSPETHRPLVATLVQRLKGQAFVPAYRLAPEHPYPAALHDARDAYRSMVVDRGIDPARIVIVGDSAGGGLALALTLALRDEGDPLPAAVVAFSPWTDLAATGASLDENSDSCAMFAGDTIRRASRFYAGAHDPQHPHMSPLYGDFRGVPPMLIHASTDEVLRDDALRVVLRARQAGVEVESRLWRRVPHVWQFFHSVLPEAEQSLRDAVTFITRHVNTTRIHASSSGE